MKLLKRTLIFVALLISCLLTYAGGSIIGAPPRMTKFVMAESYIMTIGEGQLAYGIALLRILFIVILIFTLLFFKLRILWVYTETED